SVFLPSSSSWLVVLFLSCSTFISSRRADIANSARSWSLSAWISAIDSGVAASSRRVVSRTARLCTNGTIISPHSIESRKPIARYMIGSIMKRSSEGIGFGIHNATAVAKKARALPRRREGVHHKRLRYPYDHDSSDQQGFRVARGVYFR